MADEVKWYELVGVFIMLWLIAFSIICLVIGGIFWIPDSYWNEYNLETIPARVFWQYVFIPFGMPVAIVSAIIAIIVIVWVLSEDGVL